MKLDETKINFLLKTWPHFKRKEYIIDLMTMVGNRPEFCVYRNEMPTKDKMEVTINVDVPPEGAKYIPPYTPKQMKEYEYPDDVIEALMKDPVHSWRAETGIELIHKEPDVWEQFRIYRNWMLMTDDQKSRSDEKAKELFGIDNAAMHKRCIHDHFEQMGGGVNGRIFRLVCEETKLTCVVGVIDSSEEGDMTYVYLGSGEERIVGETDTFLLKKGVLKCCKEDTETTVGRFLLNVLFIELPFDGFFDYINQTGFDIKGLEKKISVALVENKIQVEQYKRFIDNMYFIGHFCELCVPTISRGAMMTDPKIADLKKQLLEKYKGQMDDPKVISEIEDLLIKADKEYLKNDPAMRFYGALGGKAFNIARKKLYLTIGGIETFSKDSGKYVFIENSLTEGWDVNGIDNMANEIRKGSFNRGHETQLGGALTKYIMRVFQDLCIIEDDCGARSGLVVDFNLYPIEDFRGRYISDGGKWVAITSENMSKYTKGRYVMRSPMYCKTQKGLCRKCAGDIYASLNTKHIAMYIVDISSTFLQTSMKLMHGSKLSLVDIGDLNQYVIQ